MDQYQNRSQNLANESGMYEIFSKAISDEGLSWKVSLYRILASPETGGAIVWDVLYKTDGSPSKLSGKISITHLSTPESVEDDVRRQLSELREQVQTTGG